MSIDKIVGNLDDGSIYNPAVGALVDPTVFATAVFSDNTGAPTLSSFSLNSEPFIQDVAFSSVNLISFTFSVAGGAIPSASIPASGALAATISTAANAEALIAMTVENGAQAAAYTIQQELNTFQNTTSLPAWSVTADDKDIIVVQYESNGGGTITPPTVAGNAMTVLYSGAAITASPLSVARQWYYEVTATLTAESVQIAHSSAASGWKSIHVFKAVAGTTGQTITANQSVETNIALSITPVIGALTATLGLPVETDIAQTITPSQSSSVVVNQVVETDLSQVVLVSAGLVAQSVGQAIEADLAQQINTAIGSITQIINQTVESDISQAITVDVAGVSSPVNQVLEFDSSLAMTVLNSGIDQTLNQAIETNLVQPLTPLFGDISVSVLQAFESDIALTISLGTGESVALLNQAIETSLSQGIISSVSVVLQTIKQVVEFDIVNPITFSTGSTLIPIGGAFEVDQSNPITTLVGGAIVTVNKAFEVDIAFSVSVPMPVIIGGIYNVAEYFISGSSVTIELYDPVDGLAVSLSDINCIEITSTGLYIWDSSKLSVQPIGYQEYVWKMTDGTNFKGGIINMFDAQDSAKLDLIIATTNDTNTIVNAGISVSNADKIDIANKTRDTFFRTQEAAGAGDLQEYNPDAA